LRCRTRDRTRQQFDQDRLRSRQQLRGLTSYLSLQGALVLGAEEHSLDPIATARRIADHLQLPSAEEDILAALDTIAPLDHNAVATVAWENRFNASELALINGALAAYAEYFTGAPLGNLVWAPKPIHCRRYPPAIERPD
jgi:hypothetical protein